VVSINKDKEINKKTENTHAGNGIKTKQEINSNQKKGYTAANGYFGFNAVAQLGPGIQK
jgi:hypothetical protein